MQALRLCNGLIDLSLPLVLQEVRDILPRLEKFGAIRPCERGDCIAPEQEYKLYPARYIRTAHWSITGHCNYRCKHCYMSAPDAKYGALETTPDDILAPDRAACEIFKGNWTSRVMETMKKVRPEAICSAFRDR